MPVFNDPPTPEFLQALVGSSLDKPDKIQKAARLWYILNEFSSKLVNELTAGKWREHIYQAPDHGEKLPDPNKSPIVNKKISNLLFDCQEEWDNWKKNYIDFYLFPSRMTRSRAKIEENLALWEKNTPFNIGGKRILDDLERLVEIGYLQFDREGKSKSVNDKFKFVDTFPCLLSDFYSSGNNEFTKQEEIKLVDSASLPHDFSSYFNLFSKPFGTSQSNPEDLGFQRFYVHSDYRSFDVIDAEKMNSHQKLLRDIWQKDVTPLLKLKYRSASEGKINRAIISPIRIDYYQRAFFLCGYGLRDFDTELSWYNYRIDRIEKIDIIDSNTDNIPLSLQDRCDRSHQAKLIEEIKDSLEAAYGLDFYKPKKLMILRFEREFHDRYIKNIWRHNTFKQVDRLKIDKLIQEINSSEYILINERIEKYPGDVYYTMNYRVNDNSVIMRLRAWGHNMEVLSPFNLRERMREDMQKAWDFYKHDCR